MNDAEKLKKLVNFLKQEIALRMFICTTNHAVLLDNAQKLLKEIGEKENEYLKINRKNTTARKIQYQCDHFPGSIETHCLTMICEGCLRKIVNQRIRLLEFVKWCKETASCHACDYQSMLAEKLLKEIGELN